MGQVEVDKNAEGSWYISPQPEEEYGGGGEYRWWWWSISAWFCAAMVQLKFPLEK